MKDQVLDILKGSVKPLQSREIVTLLKEIHKLDVKQFEVRDLLWNELKNDIIYRGKPHWDYKIRVNYKVDVKLKSRKINYIEIGGQPLCSIHISYLKSEINYYINKTHQHYSESNEPIIIYFLEAWENLLLNRTLSENIFHEYITHLI